jgi:two-component system, NtrC family, response regulator AtoC
MRKTRDPLEATTKGLAKRDRPIEGWSVVVIADHILRSHALPESGAVVIGRSERADIQLDDPSLSRRHAVLHIGAQLELEDLGSANGSRVGERRLASRERVVVTPGESIELGNAILLIQPRVAAPAMNGPLAPTLVIHDAAMQQLHRIVDRVAVGAISVLLLGETGVGKEVMARRIHDRSPRSGAPFVSLNCAALSEQLLEGELFGFEKGAFTGADRTKPGLLETAEGGTIFLDEVGEMPLPLQTKLLRVLEERQVLRVGALKVRPIDVRFIAATNRDLSEQIARGAFRADLFFRLNGISLVIPPLRERRSEILVLARTFIAAAKPVLSDRAASALVGHDWPGNIRELRNTMERAVLLADDVIEPEHLALGAAAVATALAAAPAPARGDLHGEIDQVERRRILEALDSCGGNQSRAAIMLGISRGTLSSRLKAYGVVRSRGR